jgi:hypothetical protein
MAQNKIHLLLLVPLPTMAIPTSIAFTTTQVVVAIAL